MMTSRLCGGVSQSGDICTWLRGHPFDHGNERGVSWAQTAQKGIPQAIEFIAVRKAIEAAYRAATGRAVPDLASSQELLKRIEELADRYRQALVSISELTKPPTGTAPRLALQALATQCESTLTLTDVVAHCGQDEGHAGNHHTRVDGHEPYIEWSEGFSDD